MEPPNVKLVGRFWWMMAASWGLFNGENLELVGYFPWPHGHLWFPKGISVWFDVYSIATPWLIMTTIHNMTIYSKYYIYSIFYIYPLWLYVPFVFFGAHPPTKHSQTGRSWGGYQDLLEIKVLEASRWLVKLDMTKRVLYFVHTVDGRNPAPPWMVETL